MAVQPIRNRQVISSNLIGGSIEKSGFSFLFWVVQEGKTIMFSSTLHEQTILEIFLRNNIAIAVKNKGRPTGEYKNIKLLFPH